MRLRSDESQDPLLAARIDRDLSHRSMYGGLVYPGFLLALASATDYLQVRPGVFLLVGLLTVLCSGARFGLGYWFATLYGKSPQWWRRFFWCAVLVTGLTWGCFLAATLLWFGYYDWKTLILLVCMAGTAPVSLITMTPSLRVILGFQVCFCLPMILANLYVGGLTGFAMAAVFAWYLAFMLLFGHRVNVDYHDGLERAVSDRARIAAEESSKAKSELLGQISHELRTPLNSIVGMTHLAMTAANVEEQRAHLAIVQESSQFLIHLINDLLDISRSDAGMLVLERAPVAVHRLVQGVVASFRPQAQGLGLTITCDIDPGVPEWIEGDGGRLRQVLVNIIGNALKFTPQGGIAVAVSSVIDSGAILLQFTASDTGIGIPPEWHTAIFEPYAQADSCRRVGGTGLGLAIASRLVKLMGGTLTVKSAVGVGSTFAWHARVHATASPAPAPARTIAPVTAQLCILVAEDNAINQILMRRLLERRQHKVCVAANGYEVLQALDNDRFDLILMDVQMPGLDGLQTTSAIRRREDGTTRNVPIIALTANAQHTAREECMRVGMNAYLAKPVDPEELYEAVAAYAQARAS